MANPNTLMICPECKKTTPYKYLTDNSGGYVCPFCGDATVWEEWKPFINVKPDKDMKLPLIMLGPDADTYSPLVVVKCPDCGTGVAYCPDKGLTITDCHICGRQVIARIHTLDEGLENVDIKKDSILIMPDMTIRETGVRPEQTVIDDTEG